MLVISGIESEAPSLYGLSVDCQGGWPVGPDAGRQITDLLRPFEVFLQLCRVPSPFTSESLMNCSNPGQRILHHVALRWARGSRDVGGCTKSGIRLIAFTISASRFSGCRAKKSRSSGYHRPTHPMTRKTPLPSRFCQNSGTSGSRNPAESSSPTTNRIDPLPSERSPAARPPGSRAGPALAAPRSTVEARCVGSRQHHG
jgi:hypothetical protein